MSVSVVTTAYNEAKYLPDAIESVLEQTATVKEYVVVDDGSTDASFIVAQRYEPRLEALSISNRGMPGARNAGLIALDPCDWVVFLDGDDWLELDYIERCQETGRETGADAVLAPMLRHGADGKTKGPTMPTILHPTAAELWTECVSFSCAMFRYSALVAMGGFHPLMSGDGDWDLWLDFTRRGYEVEYCQETYYHYRIHGSSYTRKKAKMERERNRDEMARHFGLKR